MNSYGTIAPYYDYEHDALVDDLWMYKNLCIQNRQQILIAGVGTGRIAKFLAAQGHEVWGVDSCHEMLALAEAKLSVFKNVRLVETDFRAIDLEQNFSLVILPLDTFSGLEDHSQQIAALKTLAHHLKPTGALIIDQSNPHALPTPEQNGLRRTRFRVFESDAEITAVDWVTVDQANQTLNLQIEYQVKRDAHIEVLPVSLRVHWVYRREMELLLDAAGLNEWTVWGDYSGADYESESPRMIVRAGREPRDIRPVTHRQWK